MDVVINSTITILIFVVGQFIVFKYNKKDDTNGLELLSIKLMQYLSSLTYFYGFISKDKKENKEKYENKEQENHNIPLSDYIIQNMVKVEEFKLSRDDFILIGDLADFFSKYCKKNKRKKVVDYTIHFRIIQLLQNQDMFIELVGGKKHLGLDTISKILMALENLISSCLELLSYYTALLDKKYSKSYMPSLNNWGSYKYALVVDKHKKEREAEEEKEKKEKEKTKEEHNKKDTQKEDHDKKHVSKNEHHKKENHKEDHKTHSTKQPSIDKKHNKHEQHKKKH